MDTAHTFLHFVLRSTPPPKGAEESFGISASPGDLYEDTYRANYGGILYRDGQPLEQRNDMNLAQCRAIYHISLLGRLAAEDRVGKLVLGLTLTIMQKVQCQ